MSARGKPPPYPHEQFGPGVEIVGLSHYIIRWAQALENRKCTRRCRASLVSPNGSCGPVQQLQVRRHWHRQESLVAGSASVPTTTCSNHISQLVDRQRCQMCISSPSLAGVLLAQFEFRWFLSQPISVLANRATSVGNGGSVQLRNVPAVEGGERRNIRKAGSRQSLHRWAMPERKRVRSSHLMRTLLTFDKPEAAFLFIVMCENSHRCALQIIPRLR